MNYSYSGVESILVYQHNKHFTPTIKNKTFFSLTNRIEAGLDQFVKNRD